MEENHLESIVEDVKKKSEKEYSLSFGEYELVFTLESGSDKQYLKRVFMGEYMTGGGNPKIGIFINKKGTLLMQGMYETSEFIEEGRLRGTLEIHVAGGSQKEFKIYLIPEVYENIPKIFSKIFN